MHSTVYTATFLIQQSTTHDIAFADTATQSRTTCKLTPKATLSSVTGQTKALFLLLPLHSVASSIGPVVALLDSGVSHNSFLSKLVYVLQK